MRCALLTIVGVGILLCGSVGEAPIGAVPIAVEPHRNPMHLVLLPDGQRALTANHGADSVSLVDVIGGKVLAELPCGRKPIAVACSADGKHAAVTDLWSASVTLFSVEPHGLKKLREIEIGVFPRGLVFAPEGDRLYVALAGEDAVVELNWRTGSIAPPARAA